MAETLARLHKAEVNGPNYRLQFTTKVGFPPSSRFSNCSMMSVSDCLPPCSGVLHHAVHETLKGMFVWNGAILSLSIAFLTSCSFFNLGRLLSGLGPNEVQDS